MLAEKVRLALAQDAIDRAVLLLSSRASGRPAGSAFHRADLDYARFETYLAGWQRSVRLNDAEKSKSWRKKATEAANSIGRSFGPYWGRRAEILLATRIKSSLGGKDVADLEIAAKYYYNTGKFA